MRRTLILPVLVLVLAAMTGQGAQAQTPTVTVTPEHGSQFQSYTLTGSGFTPGTLLNETYISPDGESFTFYFGEFEALIEADADGSFSIIIVPAVDFAGARAGRWQVRFCELDSGRCWTVEIDISV
jgi:hypothetical protein